MDYIFTGVGIVISLTALWVSLSKRLDTFRGNLFNKEIDAIIHIFRELTKVQLTLEKLVAKKKEMDSLKGEKMVDDTELRVLFDSFGKATESFTSSLEVYSIVVPDEIDEELSNTHNEIYNMITRSFQDDSYKGEDFLKEVSQTRMKLVTIIREHYNLDELSNSTRKKLADNIGRDVMAASLRISSVRIN